MSSASMHPPYPSQSSHTLGSTSSPQRQSPSATRHPAQPPFLHPPRNQVIPLESSHHHHQQQQEQEWYPRAHDQGFDHSDHPPAAPEHSSPAQNATFTSDHHHSAQSTEAYRPNYQAYNPQADRFSAFHQPPQSAAPRHHPRQLPTSPHSDGSKHQGSLNRTSTLTVGPLRASYTSPQAQTRSDASVNNQHQGGPGRRQALTSHAHASSFDDTYKETYESPLTHAKREVQDDYGYGLPPLQHSYYSTPRSHREPNTLIRTSESSPSASGSYSHASPSTSFPPPAHPSLHHSSSRFITDDGPGGQSSRYGHPTLLEAAAPPLAGFTAAAASSSPSSSSAHRPQHHLPPLSESFGSSFPRPANNMNGLGAPMPLAPSPLDHHGYPTAINTDVPGHGSAYPLDHPFDYPDEASPGLVSPGDLPSNQASPMRSPAKRGKKVEMACHFCRGRKLKCDGVQPRCQHCTRRGQICSWDSHVRRRGPGLKNKSKDTKGGVAKRRESVSTSTGRSTISPKTPSRHSLDDPLDGQHRASDLMTPDCEFPPNHPYLIKGEEMEGDVPMTTGANSPFAAPPYPPSSNAYAQVPAQDPYATAHYPGQQHPHYGPPSPPVSRVIPMSRTPSSSLAGAMGPDPNYSAYHPSDNNQGSAAGEQDSAWRRHSIAGGQCANPSAYISETTGGGAGYWDRDNASDGGGAYAYHHPSSTTSPSTSSSAQYFNSQAVHHGYPHQQHQQYPASPSSSMGYGTQQEYAQQRGYAPSRDNHQPQHQHQHQVSPPMPGYEASWFAHPAGSPGQAWSGHVGHASAEVNPGGDSAVTHNASAFSEIRVQGSVSPSQETDPSSYHARSTSGTVSSSSTHSSPAQLPHDLYSLHHHQQHPASSTPVASRTARSSMPSSSSVDNELAQSLITLRHGPSATTGAGSATGMVRRMSSVTASGGSTVGGTAVPMTESYTMSSTTSTDTSSHRRTSSGEGSWDEARSVPRTTAGSAAGHAAIAFKNALGSNNSPHSGHEVVY